jgi:hypothetical protein
MSVGFDMIEPYHNLSTRSPPTCVLEHVLDRALPTLIDAHKVG